MPFVQRRRKIMLSNVIMRNQLALLLLLALRRSASVLGFGPLPSTVVSSTSRPICSFTPGSSSSRAPSHAGTAAAAAAVGPLSAGAADKCPVLICPAQLSVPSDYELMIAEFKER